MNEAAKYDPELRTANRPRELIVVDSITQLTNRHAGQSVLAASHGGIYCGWIAIKLELTGVILHDAGVGLARAGIAGLAILDCAGVPAAAIGHRTARIGDGADCLQRGILTFCNAAADRLGVTPGMAAAEALEILASYASAPGVNPALADLAESRSLWTDEVTGAPITLLDSNGLVDVSDRDSIIITGSHGGLLGGRSETAVKAPVFAAAYNDAGIGIDAAGISRLAVLEDRGIAGVTVAAASARIGDARSTLQDGIVSYINATAARFGAEVGMPMKACTHRFGEAWLAKFGRDRS
jgi:hypothetical protein